MKEKVFSQEGLKVMACITMLIDHIGAAIIPNMDFRIIGRLAFPIYCFLMVEGIWHTRNMKQYALRLAIGALLSEIPFDLLFFGRLTLAHQSVMVTLLLSLLAVYWGREKKNYGLPFGICFLAAELLNTDYGGWGVAIICMFAVTRELPHRGWLQLLGLALIFWGMDSYRIVFGGFRIPIQFFGLPAMLPIGLYSGEKLTRNRAAQWAFYLFYPVHLTILLLMVRL